MVQVTTKDIKKGDRAQCAEGVFKFNPLFPVLKVVSATKQCSSLLCAINEFFYLIKKCLVLEIFRFCP